MKKIVACLVFWGAAVTLLDCGAPDSRSTGSSEGGANGGGGSHSSSGGSHAGGSAGARSGGAGGATNMGGTNMGGAANMGGMRMGGMTMGGMTMGGITMGGMTMGGMTMGGMRMGGMTMGGMTMGGMTMGGMTMGGMTMGGMTMGGMTMGGAAGVEERFDFEASAQNWVDLSRPQAGYTYVPIQPVQDTMHAYHGTHSLKFTVNTMVTDNPADRLVGPVAGNIGTLLPGQVVKYHLWLPTGHPFTAVQAFFQPFNGVNGCVGTWTADYHNAGALTANGWTDFSVTVPANYTNCNPLELGFLLSFNASWSGSIWVDYITVQ